MINQYIQDSEKVFDEKCINGDFGGGINVFELKSFLRSQMEGLVEKVVSEIDRVEKEGCVKCGFPLETHIYVDRGGAYDSVSVCGGVKSFSLNALKALKAKLLKDIKENGTQR